MKHLITIIVYLLTVLCPLQAKRIYVVSIGVANYKEIGKLQNTENDAKALAALYRYKTSNVILYTGRYATRNAILKALNDQFSRAGNTDMIVFFFSGHGFHGGICPYNTTRGGKNLITYNEILSIVRRSKAKQKVLYIDACYAGGFRRTGNSSLSSSRTITDKNVVMFLASRTNELSQENRRMSNGYFTTFLVNGLKGNADSDRNRIITAKELFNFVHTNVSRYTNGQQHPVAWGKFPNDFPMLDWRK